MARVLVTGATGFVGRRLVSRLVERDADEVHGLSRHPPRAGAHGWTHHAADLADEGVGEVVCRIAPDVIFHLGGMAHPADCERDPERALEVNGGGTKRVFQALELRPARMVLASTAAVYGGQPPGPIREEAELRPHSAYGRSKQMADDVRCHAMGRPDLRPVVVARAFNHAGAGQEPRYVLAAFAAEIVRAMREGGPVRHGNLWPVRDFLHVDDVLDAYELLAEEGEPGEVYNVCRGEGVAVGALLRGLLERLAPELGTALDPALAREGEAAEIVGDPGRLRALGWSTRRSLGELLDEVAAAARTAT